MFRIYRYFAIASAVVMLVAMSIMGFVYQRQAIETLVAVAENQNIVLARSLSDIVLSRFVGDPRTGASVDLTAIRPQTAEVTDLLRLATEKSRILKIKIYSTDGLTLYSSDPADLGKDRREQPHSYAFFSAARHGEAQSELSFEDRISAFSGEVFDRDVVETYVPIIGASGGITGVFELYSDVTTLKSQIDRLIPGALLVIAVVFILLYGTLLLVVMRRAIAPLRLASERASRIGPQSPGVRLPTAGMAAEVLPLIAAVNGALDRLDHALEAQRQFTADAAHELLTPIAVLRANVDTLADEETAASFRQDVTAMTEIVTQLLELAEIDAMEAATSRPVNSRDVAFEVVAMMAPAAHAEGKEIALTGAAQPAAVACCPKALERALRNLVKNALEATPPGTAVDVDVFADGAIRVTDRGPGVPVDKREIIFQRFWRGSQRARPGAGLGLSIVKRFADTHGGSIEVADAPGGGAMFTLRLPRAAKPQGVHTEKRDTTKS